MNTTPQLQWDAFPLFAGRTEDYEFTLYKSDGTALVLDAQDELRFKLANSPSSTTPLLDIDSIEALDGGSLVTVVTLGAGDTPAKVKVRFAQDDTIALKTGERFGELGLVDVGETGPTDAFKRIAYGSVLVSGSPGGDVGTT